MPSLEVPISSPVYRNVNGEELSDQSHLLMDGYLDQLKYTNSRPGLSQFASLGLGSGKPTVGLFWWQERGVVIATAGTRIYKIERISGVASITDLTGSPLTSNLPPTFSTNGAYVFIATDGRIVYTDGTALTAYLGDVDAPVNVSDVAFLDSYILANSIGSNQFYWADVSDPFSWNPLSFASASGNAQSINGIRVMNREIYLFGPSSTERWENDGENPFSRVPGGYHEVGCIAPRSPLVTDDALYWLNHRRHIVRAQNGNIQKISTPYDKDISMYSAVADCRSFEIEINGIPFLVFCFPSEEKTLVLNSLNDTWSEWGYWDTVALEHTRWLGESYCYASDWGMHLVGSRLGSYVYEMSPNYDTDDGATIRVLRRTGHLDFGTLKDKRGHWLRMRVKRGEGGASSEPQLMIRWKDDGANRWSNEYHIGLGDAGETEIVRRFHAPGIFQTRQYEVSCSDAVQVSFGRAEQDIEYLRG